MKFFAILYWTIFIHSMKIFKFVSYDKVVKWRIHKYFLKNYQNIGRAVYIKINGRPNDVIHHAKMIDGELVIIN